MVRFGQDGTLVEFTNRGRPRVRLPNQLHGRQLEIWKSSSIAVPLLLTRLVRNRFTKSVSRDYPAPMRQNFANIRDVANHAGVSATTVSRYLNGPIPLRPDTAA